MRIYRNDIWSNTLDILILNVVCPSGCKTCNLLSMSNVYNCRNKTKLNFIDNVNDGDDVVNNIANNTN